MSIIGQPEKYSDILNRIFIVTSAIGIVASWLLAQISPTAKAFLDSIDLEAAVGFLAGIKLLYAAIPLAIGMIFRWLTLHDKVSSILGIRLRFDLNHILLPMARSTMTVPASTYSLKRARVTLMRSAFYKFASFEDPKIDSQLVRGAADAWGWYWCCIEPQLVIAMAALLFAVNAAWWHVLGCLVLSLILVLASKSIMVFLRKRASEQVNEILGNDEFRHEAERAFATLSPE